MIEAFPKRPNTEEYIEMVRNEVKDEGSKVIFVFQFASPVWGQKIQEYAEDPSSAMNSIMSAKLREKGWVDESGTVLESVDHNGVSNKDGRKWVFSFEQK